MVGRRHKRKEKGSVRVSTNAIPYQSYTILGSGFKLLGSKRKDTIRGKSCLGNIIDINFYSDFANDHSGLIFYDWSSTKSLGSRVLEVVSEIGKSLSKVPLPSPGRFPKPRF